MATRTFGIFGARITTRKPFPRCSLALATALLLAFVAPASAAAATKCTLSAVPEVSVGDPVTLTWHIEGKFSVATLTTFSGIELKKLKEDEVDGSFKNTPVKDTTYTIEGTADGKAFSCNSKRVTVKSCLMTADPTRSAKPGEEVTLTWKLVGTDIKQADIFENRAILKNLKPEDYSASAKVKPKTLTTYKLTWSNSEGLQPPCFVTVPVGPAPSCVLAEDLEKKAADKKITLKWTAPNAVKGTLIVTGGASGSRELKCGDKETATSCSGENNREFEAGSTEVMAHKSSVRYHLVVISDTGETGDCSVNVEAGCKLTVTPTKVAKDKQITLAWKAPGAKEIALEPGNLADKDKPSGKKDVKADKTTVYTLKRMSPKPLQMCSACVTVLDSGAKGDASKTLKIPPVIQQTAAWCWLAVGEMIFRYYDIGAFVEKPTSFQYQCGIVGSVFPWGCGNNCLGCAVGAGKADNVRKMLSDYPVFKFGIKPKAEAVKSVHGQGPLDPDKIKNEINAGRPIIAGINPSPSTAPPGSPAQHVALIVGYTEADGKLYIVVNDPFPFHVTKQVANPYAWAGGVNNNDGSYCISYDAFKSKKTLNWTESFDQIKK